jgi:Fur family peroxide stress response transcriptional regulator
MTTSIPFKNQLLHVGLKATHQRLAILSIISQTHTHPTVEEVYDCIKKIIPTISLATVYKTLETFVSVGLVNKVPSSQGIFRYDFNSHPHHHIHIQSSGEIIDYVDPELNTLIINHLKSKNIADWKINQLYVHIEAEKLNNQ